MFKGISKVVSLSILCAAVLLSVMVCSDSSFAAGTGDKGPQLEWSLDFHLVIPALEIAERGTQAKADALGPLLEKIKAEGMTSELLPLRTGDNGPAYLLRVSSRGSLDDFRRILYAVLGPEFSLLGGVTEMTIQGDTAESHDMELIIEANPSTGYGWHITSDSTFTERPGGEYQMYTRGRGAPERQVLHLSMDRAGGSAITLVYKRPWENGSATQHVNVRLSYLPARLDLSDPTASASSFPPVDDLIDEGAFPPVPETDLPASFDWRSLNILTPVRDQGSCGAGWAFGAVGVMEASMLKNGFPKTDLSEQFLISCNTDGWGCKGGLTAHMYHHDTLGKNQTEAGAVLEADKPYTQTDGTCWKNYNHPYKLTDWDFVTPGEFSMPTVAQIKSAIYTYGPVTAGVCAGDAMKSYSSGIFSTDETETACNFFGSNHQIDLVGWDDNDGNGYWIMRNSWGPDWGINGYMHIAYNTSRVGEGASWVITPAAPGKVKVINGSTTSLITKLYLTDSADDWGPNYLSEPIPAGGSAIITDMEAGIYNLKAIFSNGDTYKKESLAVSSGATTTVTASYEQPPDLTITKTHTDNFFHAQQGATYTIRVTNSGLGKTTGTVTVTDILPSGLTAVSMSGAGWSCILSDLTCTRSNALQPGDSYSQITLKVNVADDAPKSVTNTATVSGGGEINTSNDHAEDTTTIASAPVLGTLTPSSVISGAGTPQIFTASYSDSDGYGDLDSVCFEVNSTLSSVNGIYLCYDISSLMLALYADNGTDVVGTCTPGSPGALSNSQGTIHCGGTTTSVTGKNLTINLKITPSAAFASATAKNIYMYAIDNSGLQADWSSKGTWMIDGTPPALLDLTPSESLSPSGSGRTFLAIYSDADGYENLGSVAFLVNSTQTGVNGIYALYDLKENRLYLYNDDKTAFAGNCTPAQPGTLSNSQGTLDCLATTVTGSGNNLTVNWTIIPKAAFASSMHKNLYMWAEDLAGNATAKWTDKGDWAIAGSILGSVKTASGIPVDDVTVKLSGDRALRTATNSEGAYAFSGLDNGSYTVTPVKPGYTFSPESREATVDGRDVTGQDFTAVANTYSISGSVKSAAGVAISGVTMTLSGDKAGSTVTDSEGKYSFSELDNGSYTVTPGKPEYTFSPESRVVTVNGADVTGQDFIATANTYSISGTVTTAGGVALSGVRITLSGDQTGAAFTNRAGHYSFEGLGNGNYKVTPGKKGYTFSPRERTVTVNGADVTVQDFTALPKTYSISGRVWNKIGLGMAGVIVTLQNGDQSITTKTDNIGDYSFSGLLNGSYIVSPSMKGYVFTPDSRVVAVKGADVRGQDFAVKTYSISGTLKSFDGYGMSGISVNLTVGNMIFTTWTDSNGNYKFTGLTNGTYEIMPNDDLGIWWTPGFRVITIEDADATGQNFIGYIT